MVGRAFSAVSLAVHPATDLGLAYPEQPSAMTLTWEQQWERFASRFRFPLPHGTGATMGVSNFDVHYSSGINSLPRRGRDLSPSVTCDLTR